MSIRRISLNFRISRLTTTRKLKFLGEKSLAELHEDNNAREPAAEVVFDDFETFEHTRCKPLAIGTCVEHGSRYIYGFEIGDMKPKRRLADIAFKKYGERKDTRRAARHKLFARLRNVLREDVIIRSDMHPSYPSDVRKFFPLGTHLTFKSQNAKRDGYGELKKGHDPLWAVDHTGAMFRDNLNRMRRRTWATTKKTEYLIYHLAIYAVYHNRFLLKHPT